MTTPGSGLLQRIQEVLREHGLADSGDTKPKRWGCEGCSERFKYPAQHRDHLASLVLALFTEVVETIPVFVLNDPPEFCTKMVGPPRPKKHIEFIEHTHYATPRHSIDCPDCASDPGIHESRQAAIRAEATK